MYIASISLYIVSIQLVSGCGDMYIKQWTMTMSMNPMELEVCHEIIFANIGTWLKYSAKCKIMTFKYVSQGHILYDRNGAVLE